MTLQPYELQAAVAIAAKWRALGKITLQSGHCVAATKPLTRKELYQVRKERLAARGLTTTGHPRQAHRFFRHADLLTLKHDPKLYHRAYMRLRRGGDIKDLLP